ncbi:MAG: site-specific integrase [Burkholderiaceae bacterium]|nr:MAG: site-specific integrase [Burkholderiaceae bacterium]
MAAFLRRVGRSGQISWQAKVRLNGVYRSKTFVKKSDAAAWATSVENTINEGKPVQQRKQLQKTLADIFDDYLDSGLVTDKKERLLRRLAVEIGALKLEDLNTKRLALYLQLKSEQAIPVQARKKVDHPLYEGGKKNVGGELVAKTYKPASIRHYYYALRTALLWHAKVNDYHFNDKPFRDNPPPPAWKEPRERRLEDGELERLLNACDKMYVNQQHLKDIIEFQIYSCMRAGETLMMRWKDLIFDEKKPTSSYIYVPKEHQKIRNKRGAEDREVSMRRELFALVKDRLLPRKTEPEDRVFPFWADSNVLGHRFKVICKNAKSVDLKIHDLRHEGISWLFENTNLTDIQISKMTGHLELDTLKRYAKLRPSSIGERLWAQT